MPSQRQSRILPYSCEQMFALALDIESYPEFVPGYRSTAVTSTGPQSLTVDQSVGLGPVQQRFHSEAWFERPNLIRIRANDGPFRALEVEWRFAPDPAGCRVDFEVSYRLASAGSFITSAWLGLVAPQLLETFVRRAAQVYGRR